MAHGLDSGTLASIPAACFYIRAGEIYVWLVIKLLTCSFKVNESGKAIALLFPPSLKKINNKQSFINPRVALCKRLFREEQSAHSATDRRPTSPAFTLATDRPGRDVWFT